MQMQNDPINTAPITQFLQQVKNADSGNQKEIKIDIQTAKRLAFTIGEVMTRLNGDLESLLIRKTSGEEDVINVQVNTNSGW